jgi:hypothetical protein
MPNRCLPRTRHPLVVACLLLPAAAAAETPAAGPDDTLTVTAQRVANLQPASTYAAPVTALRFDPRVDVQPRGLPEGQADVTVRGGLFENTAFNVGPVTLLDPQTGHYVAELPLDPAMLTPPDILTGVDNALAGFNSTVATVRYGIAPVREGGDVVLGTGTDDLRFGSLRLGERFALRDGAELAVAMAYAGSQSDGSRANGDHDFDRVAARLQHVSETGVTDLLVGYQDKFYGWPGAYTGFATLPETDRTKTRLLLASHRRSTAGGGWWEAAAYHRRLEDDYDFDRTTDESGVPGAFDHETVSYAVGARALLPGRRLDWQVALQLVGDELVSSTDLVGGDFDRRRYARLALVPERTWAWDDGSALTLRGGVTVDHSNRDRDALLPVAALVYTRSVEGATDRVVLEYAATSQVPGYTALKSPPTGLFGGNPALGRETADTVALTAERDGTDFFARATLFHRRDEDLVDWTYRQGAPFARQANPLDAEVTGLELELARRWGELELVGGYTWLDKDEDYGAADVDASFYALNYAEQRLTLALRYRPRPWLDVRLDNEWSRHRDNALRASGDHAYLASLAVGWLSPLPGLRLDVVVDNLTDDDFQHFPGTPAPRRQVSLNARYRW